MSVAFLFPGQGSQRTGFLHALPDHDVAQAVLAEAADTLGADPLQLDSEGALASTLNVQLALLIAGVAGARTLQAKGVKPSMCAGHSVGAFAAAVICGALPFAAAIDCVRARALAMLAAAPAGYGMAALVGLTESRVTGLIRALQDEGAPIFLSAVNAPCQIVLSGSRPVLELAMNRARSLGAQSATLLNVAVPSHCELMLDVASAVRRALAAAELAPAHTVYICNCNSRAVDDAQSIREDLINGVVCPVRWHDATRILVERGARLLIEMQPGQSLSDLAGRAFPTLRTAAMSNMKLGSLTRLALTMSVPNS